MAGRVAGPSAPALPSGQRTAKKVLVPVVPNMAVVCPKADDANRNRCGATSYRSLASPSRMSDDRSSDSHNGNTRASRPNLLNTNGSSTFCGYGNENGHLSGKRPGMSFACSTEPSHRNSTGSSSSQGSSGFESMKSSTVASASSSSSSFHTASLTPSSHLDSPPSRISVHSNGSGGSGPSSLASCSVDTLDDSSYGSFHENPINVTAMVAKGVPEAEILALWLDRMGMSEYLSLFLTQGYDLSSIARITPEDLCALGVASPAHRKRLMQEIHSWQITDSWPAVPPNGGLREWLNALALPEYHRTFEAQGYDTVHEVMKLTWEDFEEIGIKRLGHLKRLGLAIKKLKDFRRPTCQPMETSVGVRANLGGPSPMVARARPADPPPPAPSSSFQTKSTVNGSIDYLSYARGSKHPPAPPIRGQVEEFATLSGDCRTARNCYDALFDTREPIKLNLVPTGRILSEAARSNDPPFPSGPLPAGADCPPPPAPLFCEGSIRRLQSVVTSTPSTSGSSSSLEQIPFANENCGTIRSRDHRNPSSTHSQSYQMSSSIMKPSYEDPNSKRTDNSSSTSGASVLNDIGFMLQNLTDELDAMLSPPKDSGHSFPTN